MLPLAAIFVGSHLLVSVAAGVPGVDFNKTCQFESMQSTDIAQDKDSCIRDQQSARDQLTRQWAQFPASDKSICLDMATRSYLPGYVELLTCLEMFKFSKSLPEEQARHPERSQR